MTHQSNYKAFFIILFSIAIISCSKDFLDVSPQGTLTDEAAAKDPLIARKVENDTKLNRLLHDASMSLDEFRSIANQYNIRYFVTRSTTTRNVGRPKFPQLVHREGQVRVYAFGAEARAVR